MFAQQLEEKDQVIALLKEQCVSLRSMFDEYKANSDTQHRITEQVVMQIVCHGVKLSHAVWFIESPS